jgi:hypothetical protein
MASNTSSIKSGSVQGWKWIAVLSVLTAMTGAGAYGVAVVNDPSNTVPIAIGDSVTAGSAIQWDIANPAGVTVTGATVGNNFVTKPEIVVNVVMDVSEKATITLPIENLSSQQQVVKVKATAPSTLILDVVEGTGTSNVRLIGHNEWMFTIGTVANKTIKVDVFSTDPGFFSLVLELSDP